MTADLATRVERGDVDDELAAAWLDADEWFAHLMANEPHDEPEPESHATEGLPS